MRLPTIGQAVGAPNRVGSGPSRGDINRAYGQSNLANAIAYRSFLKQLTQQRQATDKQMEAVAQRAQQMGQRIQQQGKAAQEKMSIIAPPAPQAISYGGNSVQSTLASRPPVNVKLPEFPNYPTAYPDAPKLPSEPVGSMERGMRDYFYSMSEKNRHDTDKTFYNQWRKEMGAKDDWRKQLEKIDKDYTRRVEQFNKGLDAYNKGVASYQTGLNAFNAEMQAREADAKRPQIELMPAPPSQADAQKRTVRRGVTRGSLLAGNTGGFNPATGGGRLGARSLLGGV